MQENKGLFRIIMVKIIENLAMFQHVRGLFSKMNE